MGVKTVLHESNAFVGRANRFLSKKADLIFVAYENLENQFPQNKKIIVSGTPVRKEFKSLSKDESRKCLNLNTEDFLVISFSGSGGAKKINESSIDLMKLISGNENIKYIHVTGKSYFNVFMKKLKEMDLKFEENIEILPYIDDMPLYMNASDLLITRGGAMTLAEIVASKTPSIIIPSPNVKDNHQEHNGRAMEEAGAAIMIREEELNHSEIYKLIMNFSNNKNSLENMRKKCFSLDKNNALDIIIKGIKGVL